jgi:hypothetical protein
MSAARRLLAAAVPLLLAFLVAYRSGPGSQLHAHLAVWPAGQAALASAHAAAQQLSRHAVDAAQHAQRRVQEGAWWAWNGKQVKQQVLTTAASMDGATCHLQGTVDDCCELPRYSLLRRGGSSSSVRWLVQQPPKRGRIWTAAQTITAAAPHATPCDRRTLLSARTPFPPTRPKQATAPTRRSTASTSSTCTRWCRSWSRRPSSATSRCGPF